MILIKLLKFKIQAPAHALCDTFAFPSSRSALHILSRTEYQRLRAAPYISEYTAYLGDVFSLAGGVVLGLALVLELLHAHLTGKNGIQQ